MAWIASGNCTEAQQFGFFVGVLSGVFVDIIVVVLAASATSYRRGVPTIFTRPTRTAIQSLFATLPWLLVIVWSASATHVGPLLVSCYATHLALAAAIVIAPIVLTALCAAANKIGTTGVRS
jgi:hypothetical protein